MYYFLFFYSLTRRTPTSTLFPYTTLFRSYFITYAYSADFASGKWGCSGRSPPPLCPATSALPSRPTISTSTSRDGKRSEEHTSELQSLRHLVCRLLLEKKTERVQTRRPRH